MQADLDVIMPDWDAPRHVTALCTTRCGGVSQGGYSSLNLADHVGDRAADVAENRQRLVDGMQLPSSPQWLQQTHSIRAIDLDRESRRDGDAALTRTPGQVAVVLTADCLPVLLSNRAGSEVAAAHAGWRGLLNGVVEQTVAAMRSTGADLVAWLGPAIGPGHFEVGEEVRTAFLRHDAGNAPFFVATDPEHYLADLYAIARRRLQKLGIRSVCGGEFCTWRDHDKFFSYRRERHSGRQASLIYINKEHL